MLHVYMETETMVLAFVRFIRVIWRLSGELEENSE